MAIQTSQCPYCAEMIMAEAVKCRHCGEYLDEDLRLQRQGETRRVTFEFNPGLAAVLSIVGTGFGQIYQMRIVAALLFMASMVFFLFLGAQLSSTFLLAAVVIHLTNIWEAYLWRPVEPAYEDQDGTESQPVLNPE